MVDTVEWFNVNDITAAFDYNDDDNDVNATLILMMMMIVMMILHCASNCDNENNNKNVTYNGGIVSNIKIKVKMEF